MRSPQGWLNGQEERGAGGQAGGGGRERRGEAGRGEGEERTEKPADFKIDCEKRRRNSARDNQPTSSKATVASVVHVVLVDMLVVAVGVCQKRGVSRKIRQGRAQEEEKQLEPWKKMKLIKRERHTGGGGRGREKIEEKLRDER